MQLQKILTQRRRFVFDGNDLRGCTRHRIFWLNFGRLLLFHHERLLPANLRSTKNGETHSWPRRPRLSGAVPKLCLRSDMPRRDKCMCKLLDKCEKTHVGQKFGAHRDATVVSTVHGFRRAQYRVPKVFINARVHTLQFLHLFQYLLFRPGRNKLQACFPVFFFWYTIQHRKNILFHFCEELLWYFAAKNTCPCRIGSKFRHVVFQRICCFFLEQYFSRVPPPNELAKKRW